MKEPTLPLDVIEIQKCIPHRFPFLLIDRVTHLKIKESVTAIKLVSYSDFFLQGHFPGFPLYPGVMVIEGMAQASAVLGHYTLDGFKELLLAEVSNTRFRKKIVPGDTLRYEMTIEKFRPPFFWFEGNAFVEQDLVASVHFSALMK